MANGNSGDLHVTKAVRSAETWLVMDEIDLLNLSVIKLLAQYHTESQFALER